MNGLVLRCDGECSPLITRGLRTLLTLPSQRMRHDELDALKLLVLSKGNVYESFASEASGSF